MVRIIGVLYYTLFGEALSVFFYLSKQKLLQLNNTRVAWLPISSYIGQLRQQNPVGGLRTCGDEVWSKNLLQQFRTVGR